MITIIKNTEQSCETIDVRLGDLLPLNATSKQIRELRARYPHTQLWEVVQQTPYDFRERVEIEVTLEAGETEEQLLKLKTITVDGKEFEIEKVIQRKRHETGKPVVVYYQVAGIRFFDREKEAV